MTPEERTSWHEAFNSQPWEARKRAIRNGEHPDATYDSTNYEDK